VRLRSVLLATASVAISGFLSVSALAQNSSTARSRPQSPSFEEAFKIVMDSQANDFQDLKVGDGRGVRADKSGRMYNICCGQPAYNAKVVLPGFHCGILGGQSYQPNNPSQKFRYVCVLIDNRAGNLGPEMRSAYESLVEKVRLLTGLPSHKFLNNGAFKVETRPGSGVFEGSQTTTFSSGGDNPFGKPFVSVYLNGVGGVGGGWDVTLEIGTSWPD